MKNKTFKIAGITMLSTLALSATLIAPVLENTSASASATHYELKAGKNSYVYKNKQIKATKSHSAKSYFGKTSLTVKKTITIKRHGKKLVYKFVVSTNGKSGYVYAGSIKKISVKHVAKVKKAKKISIKKVTSNKKVAKKHSKKTTWEDLLNNSSNNGSTTPMTNDQMASQIKADFINYVNNQRRINGKSAWVQNDALTRVAEKRVSYVDPDTGQNSHYTTADGVYHAEGAPVVDAASLGYNMSSGLYESNAEASLTYMFATPDFFLDSFGDMINNDEDSYNGHRDQLLGNEGQGLNNVGVAVKVTRETDSDGNDMMRAVIVILSSDKAY